MKNKEIQTEPTCLNLEIRNYAGFVDLIADFVIIWLKVKALQGGPRHIHPGSFAYPI